MFISSNNEPQPKYREVEIRINNTTADANFRKKDSWGFNQDLSGRNK
jgi:hypothetical protein